MPLCIETYIPMDNNTYIYLHMEEGTARGEERERKGKDLEREQLMGEPKRDREMTGLEQSWEVQQSGRPRQGVRGRDGETPPSAALEYQNKQRVNTKGKNPAQFLGSTTDL